MKDWNSIDIEVIKNLSGKIFTLHPDQNLVKNGKGRWPPPEISLKNQEKYCKTIDLHIDPEALKKSALGYYCEMQSLSSVSAITWSTFGTIAREPQEAIEKWLNEFFSKAGLKGIDTKDAQIFLWRQLPTNEKGKEKNRSEISVGISTANALILVLTCWVEDIKEEIAKQIASLDSFLCREESTLNMHTKETSMVGISYSKGFYNDIKTPENCKFRQITWKEVCCLKERCNSDELKRYYDWKQKHST